MPELAREETAATSARPARRPAPRHRVRLKARFLIWSTSLTAALMTFVVLVVEKQMGDLIVRQARQRGLSIARNLAAVSQSSLVTYNYVALTQSAERAQREEEGIAAVIILNKEGRVAAYSQHPERQGAVLGDPRSRAAGAATSDLVVPVDITREEPSRVERGLDIAVPVYPEGSREKWGTVRILLSTEDMHRQIRETRLTLLGVGLAAVGLGVLGAFFMARRVTRPLSDLVEGTVRAAEGDLSTRIEIHTGDEIEELARDFNAMIGQIQANQAAVEELNRGLEVKVRARTEDLERTNAALKQAYEELRTAEAQLVLSEKMASLGQIVAGIAHEINTPASAISAAAANIGCYLDAFAGQIRALEVPPAVEERFWGVVTKTLAANLARKRSPTAEIRERSRGLEPVLAALRVRSPRELALTFARLGLHEEIAELVRDDGLPAGPALLFLENLGNLAIAVNDIRLSIDAVSRMVKALKGYSHPEPSEMSEADIHEGIETTLTILRNQVRYGVVVERKYARLPPVTCNTSELNQVWTNVIHNAIQAMKGMGRLTIETYREGGLVGVRITDTGPGIPEAIRGRIFDPFFTTKDQGEGSGLGLGICQQIVQRHGGRINVDSEPGRTSFEVLLPLGPPGRESEAKPGPWKAPAQGDPSGSAAGRS